MFKNKIKMVFDCGLSITRLCASQGKMLIISSNNFGKSAVWTTMLLRKISSVIIFIQKFLCGSVNTLLLSKSRPSSDDCSKERKLYEIYEIFC